MEEIKRLCFVCVGLKFLANHDDLVLSLSDTSRHVFPPGQASLWKVVNVY